MRFFTPDPIAEDVVDRMRSLKTSGIDRERLIGEMRGAGLHIIECIKLVRDFYGISMGDAKRIVHYSDAWTDMREPAERLHEQLFQAARDEGWTVTEEAILEEQAPAAAA